MIVEYDVGAVEGTWRLAIANPSPSAVQAIERRAGVREQLDI